MAVKVYEEHVLEQHGYLNQNLDPLLGPIIEKLLKCQPENISAFIISCLNSEKLPVPERVSSSRSIIVRRRQMAQYMALNITPVIQSITTAILLQKPDDISKFLLDFLAEKQFRAEKQYKAEKLVFLVLGLDNSGKSTLLSTIQEDISKEHTPSIGFTSIDFQLGATKVSFYDLGGGKTFRDLWIEYYADSHGIIFVLDVSDDRRFEEAIREFTQAMTNPLLQGKPVLIYANKQDQENKQSTANIANRIHAVVPGALICECTAKPKAFSGTIDPRVESSLRLILNECDQQYHVLDARVKRDTLEKAHQYDRKKEEQRQRVQRWKEESENNTMQTFDKEMHQQNKEIESTLESNNTTASSEIMCSECNSTPATTKCAASKWMPVCNKCLNDMKKR